MLPKKRVRSRPLTHCPSFRLCLAGERTEEVSRRLGAGHRGAEEARGEGEKERGDEGGEKSHPGKVSKLGD